MMLFINKMFLLLQFEDCILDERMLIFNSFLLLLRWLKGGKNKVKTSLCYLFTL